MKTQRKWGWRPDTLDHRDWGLEKLLKPIPIKRLPASVDLRSKCSPVEDQGQLGSCTANALVGNLEFLIIKDVLPFVDLARLFVYYNERVIENSVGDDAGAMLRDGIKALVQWGCCTEKLLPYDVSKFAKKPSSACYADGKKRIITGYARLNTLNDMRQCLAAGFPFVFGFTVYPSFMTAQVAKTGKANLPDGNERPEGGHAVCAVGYVDSIKCFVVRNSWGTGWGMKGYFTLPYAYLTDRNLSDDLWTIRAGNNL